MLYWLRRMAAIPKLFVQSMKIGALIQNAPFDKKNTPSSLQNRHIHTQYLSVSHIQYIYIYVYLHFVVVDGVAVDSVTERASFNAVTSTRTHKLHSHSPTHKM